jgi:hypothetical protein
VAHYADLAAGTFSPRAHGEQHMMNRSLLAVWPFLVAAVAVADDGAIVLHGRDGAAAPLTFVVEETGHFQAFAPRPVGRVRLAAAGAVHQFVRHQFPLRAQSGHAPHRAVCTQERRAGDRKPIRRLA